MKTATTLALVGLLLSSVPASADTLSIIGVVVKGTDRVGGATVKLYSTSNKTGTPLAEDHASDRGVFDLYRTNIAGDLGDLFVVYEGDDGVAQPLKISAASAKNGLIEIRTPDLVVLPAQTAANLTQEQAAQAIAAVSSTESVLVEAGVKDPVTAKAAVDAKTAMVLSKVSKQELQIDQLQGKTQVIIPQKEMKGFALDPQVLAKESIQKNIAAIKGRGGHDE